MLMRPKHVDAAQGFGKDLNPLMNKRIDMISVSAHKIYGPQGVGALLARKRSFKRPPLQPITFGGGQERSLRPGTIPVPLVIGLGAAAENAKRFNPQWHQRCMNIREAALAALGALSLNIHTDLNHTLPNVLNFSIDGLDSEAIIVVLKEVAAVSNGSACTSTSYTPSHVLVAMEREEKEIQGAVRVSWCHMTPDVDWSSIAEKIRQLM